MTEIAEIKMIVVTEITEIKMIDITDRFPDIRKIIVRNCKGVVRR